MPTRPDDALRLSHLETQVTAAAHGQAYKAGYEKRPLWSPKKSELRAAAVRAAEELRLRERAERAHARAVAQAARGESQRQREAAREQRQAERSVADEIRGGLSEDLYAAQQARYAVQQDPLRPYLHWLDRTDRMYDFDHWRATGKLRAVKRQYDRSNNKIMTADYSTILDADANETFGMTPDELLRQLEKLKQRKIAAANMRAKYERDKREAEEFLMSLKEPAPAAPEPVAQSFTTSGAQSTFPGYEGSGEKSQIDMYDLLGARGGR